jgi:hypothetical protein
MITGFKKMLSCDVLIEETWQRSTKKSIKRLKSSSAFGEALNERNSGKPHARYLAYQAKRRDFERILKD